MPASLIQSAKNSGGAFTSSLVLTFPAAVGGSRAVLISIAADVGHLDPGGPSTLSISVSGLSGGSWVAEQDNYYTGIYLRFKTYRRIGVTSGSTITITTNRPVTSLVAIAAEFSGVSTVLSQPDVEATSGDVSGPPPGNPQELTTTRDEDVLWLAIFGNGSGFDPVTPGGGFTELDEIKTTTPGFPQDDAAVAVAWRGQSAVGTHAPVYANATGPEVWHFIAYALTGPAAVLAAATSEGIGEMQAMLTAPHSSAIPTSPIALPERWMVRPPGQADWTDLSSWAYIVPRTGAADDHPALRGQDAPYASRQGRQVLDKLSDGRTILLAFYVQPMNAAGVLIEPTERRQARANLDALQAILVLQRDLELLRVMPDGSGRVAAARVSQVRKMEDADTAAVVGLLVDFFLADPWFYGLTVTDSATISGATTSRTIANPGSVPTDYLVIEVPGAITGLRIANLRNGHILEYLPAIASTQRLIVNVRAQTARVNGASVLSSLTHYGPAGDAALFRLEPGDNPIEITVTASGGSVVTTARPAYV